MSSAKKMKSDPKTTLLVIVLGMLVVYLVFKKDWALLVALGEGAVGLLSGFVAESIGVRPTVAGGAALVILLAALLFTRNDELRNA